MQRVLMSPDEIRIALLLTQSEAQMLRLFGVQGNWVGRQLRLAMARAGLRGRITPARVIAGAVRDGLMFPEDDLGLPAMRMIIEATTRLRQGEHEVEAEAWWVLQKHIDGSDYIEMASLPDAPAWVQESSPVSLGQHCWRAVRSLGLDTLAQLTVAALWGNVLAPPPRWPPVLEKIEATCLRTIMQGLQQVQMIGELGLGEDRIRWILRATEARLRCRQLAEAMVAAVEGQHLELSPDLAAYVASAQALTSAEAAQMAQIVRHYGRPGWAEWAAAALPARLSGLPPFGAIAVATAAGRLSLAMVRPPLRPPRLVAVSPAAIRGRGDVIDVAAARLSRVKLSSDGPWALDETAEQSLAENWGALLAATRIGVLTPPPALEPLLETLRLQNLAAVYLAIVQALADGLELEIVAKRSNSSLGELMQWLRMRAHLLRLRYPESFWLMARWAGLID